MVFDNSWTITSIHIQERKITMIQKPNRIIVPANYDIEVTIAFDSRSGQTELRIKNGKPINMLVVAGLLSNHASELLKQIITSTVKTEVIKTEGEKNRCHERNVQ